MNNHPRGSCVFMCVFLCIGVLIAMGFSQSTALLINEWSSVSENPLQKLQTRQTPPPTPHPNKNRRAITSNTLLYLLFFYPSISDHPHSLQLWTVSFAWHLNSPGLEWLHVGKASATPTLTSTQLLNLFLSALLLLQHTHAQTHKGSFSRKRLVPLYLHI